MILEIRANQGELLKFVKGNFMSYKMTDKRLRRQVKKFFSSEPDINYLKVNVGKLPFNNDFLTE